MRKSKSDKKHRRIRLFLLGICLFFLTLLTVGLLINATVLKNAEGKIFTPEQAVNYELPADTFDIIVVFGSGVDANGNPKPMLQDRIDTGVQVYKAGYAPILLMSGDSEEADVYDETGAMQKAALEAGVLPAALEVDPLGLSTRETLLRLKENYDVSTVLLVTQGYHLPRAIYIAEQLGFVAYGVDAELQTYSMQWYRDLREVAARIKDSILLLK